MNDGPREIKNEWTLILDVLNILIKRHFLDHSSPKLDGE